MTVKEVLEAAREAALELRRLDEEARIRRELIGVQGHSYGFHPKVGILDPSRHIDELLDWEMAQRDNPDITGPIDEAWDVVSGIATICDEHMLSVVTAYYLRAESWNAIARSMSHEMGLDSYDRADQVKILSGSLESAMGEWERVGIAHLKAMGRDA